MTSSELPQPLALPNPALLFAAAQDALARSQELDSQASGNRGQSARLAAEHAGILAYLAVAAALAQANAADSPSALLRAQLEHLAADVTGLRQQVAELRAEVEALQPPAVVDQPADEPPTATAPV